MTVPVVTPASVVTFYTTTPGLVSTFNIGLSAATPGRMVIIAYLGSDINGGVGDVKATEITLGSAALTNNQIKIQGSPVYGAQGADRVSVEVFAVKNADLPASAGSYSIAHTINRTASQRMLVAFEITDCPFENFTAFNTLVALPEVLANVPWGQSLAQNGSEYLKLYFSAFKISNTTGPLPVLTNFDTPVAEIMATQIGCAAISSHVSKCPETFLQQFSLDQSSFLRAGLVLSFHGTTFAATADLGGPYNALLNQPITLTATITIPGSDPNPIYSWGISTGGTGSADTPNALSTNFTPFNVGLYRIFFQVKGCGNEQSTVLVDVNVTALPPTADAGGPYTGVVNTPTLLDGSQLVGTDPNPIETWRIVSGGQGVFNDANLLDPTFTPAAIGPYVLELSVNPNDGPNVLSQATFDSTAPPTVAPTVDAGGPYIANVLAAVQLMGVVTPGSDAMPVSLWTITSGPAGGIFGSPNNPSSTFTPEGAGAYLLTLTTTPNDGPPVASIANLDSQVVPPVVSAGSNSLGKQGEPMNIFGSITLGTDINPLIEWLIQSGGTGTFNPPNAAQTQFTPDVVGSYVLTLRVTPDVGLPVSDNANFTAFARLPTVDAGGPYLVLINQPATLAGVVTPGSEPNPPILWTINSAPAGGGGVFSDATSPTSTFTPDTLGKYVLALSATATDANPVAVVTGMATLDVRAVALTFSKQHNDLKLAATGGSSNNDGFLAFLLANGATANNIPDAENQFLLARGVPQMRKNDMWYAFLTNIPSLPLGGHIADMKRQWWTQGGPLT